MAKRHPSKPELRSITPNMRIPSADTETPGHDGFASMLIHNRSYGLVLGISTVTEYFFNNA